AQRYKVALLPSRPPDLARGRALYAESCAACHGADGHAPPKEEHELSTQPPSFAVASEVEELSPQRIFSATTYGVPNTAMPGYEEALDDGQRWDLAYFVLSLAHRTPADVRRGLSLARAALIPSRTNPRCAPATARWWRRSSGNSSRSAPRSTAPRRQAEEGAAATPRPSSEPSTRFSSGRMRAVRAARSSPSSRRSPSRCAR